mmetsp:Transcript_82100/g.150117  ORF Transcript_82100/g.150117 Transcript_82100/m.150117 type:complete len:924 (-) Transcript_82100:26-2797(-)
MPVLGRLPLRLLPIGVLTAFCLDPFASCLGGASAVRQSSSDSERAPGPGVHAAVQVVAPLLAEASSARTDSTGALQGARVLAPAPAPAPLPGPALEASVFAEESDYPEGSAQAVELLRWVTAYGTGIEAVVDLTPYSPLLHAASEEGKLTFYSFIDTWVDNRSGLDIVYLNNITQKCYPAVQFYGNGWGLDAELLFWPAAPSVQADTRPYASVTLASGFFGSTYRIGAISTHLGTLMDSGSGVDLLETVDLTDAKSATVYPCSDGAEVQRSALLGYLAQESQNAAVNGDPKLIEGVDYLAQDMFEMLAAEQLARITIISKQADNLSATASYDPRLMQVSVGTPVYFDLGEVYTDYRLDIEQDGEKSDYWTNSSTPFYPVGNVTAVDNGTLTLVLNVTCLPDNATHDMPHFAVPKTHKGIEQVRKFVFMAQKLGLAYGQQDHNKSKFNTNLVQSGEQAMSGQHVDGPPLLLAPKLNKEELEQVKELGKVDLTNLSPGASQIKLLQAKPSLAGRRHPFNFAKKESVCVVAQRRQGHLFNRAFSLPTLRADDRVLLQLSVTGHGWSATTEQCGEYCHAVYHIAFNGTNVLNATQWRDDCKANPTGSMQRGTWMESRNGWCPGSVEPGLFVDVTDWVTSGANFATVDLSVWSSVLESYEPYTDYGGFALGDSASLSVGLSLFVYAGAAVNEIRLQPRAYTAAEAALRDGSSAPSALQPPAHPVSAVLPAFIQAKHASRPSDASRKRREAKLPRPRMRRRLREALLLARGLGAVSRGSAQLAMKPSAGRLRGLRRSLRGASEERFDFEKRAPWYFYNSTNESAADLLNPMRVPVFTNSIQQGNSRILTMNLSRQLLPEAWGQVALHLHVHKPPGKLETDHWDRECSLGLLLSHASTVSELKNGAPSTVALHHQQPVRVEAKQVPLAAS